MPPPRTIKHSLALLLSTFLALTASPCALAQSPPPAADMPTIAPTHVPVFSGSDSVSSIAFAPDKPSLFVLSRILTANPWPNLVALWPEILGGIVALATLVFLLVLRGLKRRPRIVGKPYCRRCNYDLTAHTTPNPSEHTKSFTWPPAARCPECGTTLDRAKPVRGRRFAHRLAPALAIWLCLILPYAALFAFRTPRNNAAASWFDLSSTWAATNANSFALQRLGLKPLRTDHIVEVDLATGKVIRTVSLRGSTTYFTLAISPDGRTLFLQSRDKNTLNAISVATGRITSSTKLPGTPMVDVQNPTVLGFTPDGAAAYVQWWNDAGNKSGVARWNWRTGELNPSLTEASGFARNPGNWPRLFGLRDHNGVDAAPRFYSIVNFMETMSTKKFNITLHDGAGAPRSIDVQPLPNPMQHPAMSADGGTLYLSGESMKSMVGIDLNSGMRAGELENTANADHFANSASGRYVILSGIREIQVRDTAEKKWHLRATLSPALYASRASVSPDGRWLAAVCQGGDSGSPGKPSSIIHPVVIWDLGPHRLIEPPATP